MSHRSGETRAVQREQRQNLAYKNLAPSPERPLGYASALRPRLTTDCVGRMMYYSLDHCRACGVPIRPRRYDQKYCSHACQKAGKRMENGR